MRLAIKGCAGFNLSGQRGNRIAEGALLSSAWCCIVQIAQENGRSEGDIGGRFLEGRRDGEDEVAVRAISRMACGCVAVVGVPRMGARREEPWQPLGGPSEPCLPARGRFQPSLLWRSEPGQGRRPYWRF